MAVLTAPGARLRHNERAALASRCGGACRAMRRVTKPDLSLTLANLGSSWESGILQGKWIRREFCHCLGLAVRVKKLIRPIFDASNDR
jgi:hypothetical protein